MLSNFVVIQSKLFCYQSHDFLVIVSKFRHMNVYERATGQAIEGGSERDNTCLHSQTVLCLPALCSDFYAPHRSLANFCFTPDSFGAEDSASYLPSWRKLDRNTSHRINQSPWVYHSAGETGTSSIRGKHQTFSGGGYLIPVWSSRHLRMVESLEKLHHG